MVASRPMKNKFAILVLLGLTAVISVGCVGTLDGHHTAAWPLMKDKLEGRYELPAAQVFAAAKEVLDHNGRLYGENTITHTLEANINTRTVWVKITELNPQVTQVLVQTRTKGGGTDLELTSEIDKQIALRLATGQKLTPFDQNAGKSR